MQTIRGSNNVYTPGIVPSDINQLPLFLTTELLTISGVINYMAQGHIDKSYAAPSKPREGDIRLADGTTWNPGSGAGVYGYYGSAWHFLG